MNKKRLAVWLTILAIAAITVVGGVRYYKYHHNTALPAPVENSGGSSSTSTTATTVSSSIAFIYENDRFQGGDPYNNAEFVLYDTADGSSTTLKAFDASFAPLSDVWQWKTSDGMPIVLSTIYNNTATTSEIEFFDPQTDTVNSTTIVHSPIIDPNASIGISSMAEKIAYCDDEGQFIVLNAEDGTKRTFDSLPAPACYTGAAAQGPLFLRNGTSLYYVVTPLINEKTGAYTFSQIWKLDFTTGTDTRASWIDVRPTNYRISPDGTQFADIQYGGFTIRDLAGGPEDPAYDQSSAIDSLRIARDVTLPKGAVVGDIMFTQDGKGVFYYTFTYSTTTGGSEQPGNYELGYYDSIADKNYYPLSGSFPKIIGMNLLGSLDKDHLVYETIAVPFMGTSQAGHIIASTGSSSLYIQGVDSAPKLIDTGIAGFSLKSFLFSK